MPILFSAQPGTSHTTSSLARQFSIWKMAIQLSFAHLRNNTQQRQASQAPSYKMGPYDRHKWGYGAPINGPSKSATGVISPRNQWSYFTLLITGFWGPDCRNLLSPDCWFQKQVVESGNPSFCISHVWNLVKRNTMLEDIHWVKIFSDTLESQGKPYF